MAVSEGMLRISSDKLEHVLMIAEYAHNLVPVGDKQRASF